MKAAVIGIIAISLQCVHGQLVATQVQQFIPAEPFTRVRRGRVVARGLNVPTDYTVAFTVRILGAIRGWSNLIRIGTGGNCCGYGQRIPAIFIYSGRTQLHQTDGHLASGSARCSPEPTLRRNVVYEMEYQFRGSETKVLMNGTQISSCRRAGRRAFTRATVYAGDPWHNTPNAEIKNFRFINNALNDPSAPDITLVGPQPVQLQPIFLGTLNVPSYAHTFEFTYTPVAVSRAPATPQPIWSVTDVTGVSASTNAVNSVVTAAYMNYRTNQVQINISGSMVCQGIPVRTGQATKVTISFIPASQTASAAYQIFVNNAAVPLCAVPNANVTFSVGSAFEVFLAQERAGSRPSTYATGNISSFSFTGVPVAQQAQTAALAAAVATLSAAIPASALNLSNQVLSDQRTFSGAVSVQISTSQGTLSTAINTQISASQGVLSTAVSTQMATSMSTLSSGVSTVQVQMSTNISSQISMSVSSMRQALESAITNAANNMPNPTSGPTSGSPNIVADSTTFSVDAGNLNMSFKTQCGTIDPCDIARTIAALKNL